MAFFLLRHKLPAKTLLFCQWTQGISVSCKALFWFCQGWGGEKVNLVLFHAVLGACEVMLACLRMIFNSNPLDFLVPLTLLTPGGPVPLLFGWLLCNWAGIMTLCFQVFISPENMPALWLTAAGAWVSPSLTAHWLERCCKTIITQNSLALWRTLALWKPSYLSSLKNTCSMPHSDLETVSHVGKFE